MSATTCTLIQFWIGRVGLILGLFSTPRRTNNRSATSTMRRSSSNQSVVGFIIGPMILAVTYTLLESRISDSKTGAK